MELRLRGNQLQEVDLAPCPRLTLLDLADNQLQRVDLSKHRNLTWLYLSSNNLSQLDVSANVNLIELGLSRNKLTEIDLTKNPKLYWLQLQENRLARVGLCIAGNVEEERYTGKGSLGYYFNFSDQESTGCRVQLKCDGEEKAVREKAGRIAEQWRERYSREYNNKHKCAYDFKVL